MRGLSPRCTIFAEREDAPLTRRRENFQDGVGINPRCAPYRADARECTRIAIKTSLPEVAGDVGQMLSVRRMYPRDSFQTSLGDRLRPCHVMSAVILAFAEYRFEAGFTLLILPVFPKRSSYPSVEMCVSGSIEGQPRIFHFLSSLFTLPVFPSRHISLFVPAYPSIPEGSRITEKNVRLFNYRLISSVLCKIS